VPPLDAGQSNGIWSVVYTVQTVQASKGGPKKKMTTANDLAVAACAINQEAIEQLQARDHPFQRGSLFSASLRAKSIAAGWDPKSTGRNLFNRMRQRPE
jgi:hypothetical protein